MRDSQKSPPIFICFQSFTTLALTVSTRPRQQTITHREPKRKTKPKSEMTQYKRSYWTEIKRYFRV